ncbi:MAG: endonuclease/exonuclease/phosphatase family protein [Deltaproteobacteria bacterium]|nr:endonuclease/exonuclease/phosphatase family protein [Deltaproteobacteria bacterium]
MKKMVSTPGSATPLTIASYNIHRCIGKDGLCDPGRIAGVLKKLKATIIGLQEVDSSLQDGKGLSQIDHLSRALGFEVVAGPTIHRHNGYYGNALLTCHEIQSTRHIDLSFPDCEPRCALEVELAVEGQRVQVIITHLGLKGEERRAQITHLRRAISMNRDGLTVILGDFNEWRWGSRNFRSLPSHFGSSINLRTYPSQFPIFSLDRIFVRPSTALLGTEVHSTPLSRISSDHLPIKAFVRING